MVIECRNCGDDFTCSVCSKAAEFEICGGCYLKCKLSIKGDEE